MRFIFISDFFYPNVLGGAEMCNHVLIEELLEQKHEVIKMSSHEASLDFLKSLPEHKIIISNFINVKQEVIFYVKKNREYIIYEHDHKYLKNRNPSAFKDYQAPHYAIINEELYNNAKSVFCQSELHKKVLNKNLPQVKTYNCAGNLWSKEHINLLRHYAKNVQCDDVVAIMDSNITHKGTLKAVETCTRNGKPFRLIKGDYESFIEQLSNCKEFLFLPQTLETLSRVIVEARMLGVKVRTSSNVGAIHEKWFSEYKGEDLIDYMEQKPQEIVAKLKEVFNVQNVKVNTIVQSNEDITVILNLYARPQNLKEQICSVLNQTVKPKEIWVWCNEPDYSKMPDGLKTERDKIVNWCKNYKIHSDVQCSIPIKVFDNNHNWKFYGRFAAALLTDTKYVALFDDDTIPGTHWFENCLKTMKTHNGIMGAVGYYLDNRLSTSKIDDRVGWPNSNEKVQEVDYVGHGWFLRRDHLLHLWKEKPPTWDNGEDMFLSYTAQKYGNVKTYVPPHFMNDKRWWGSVKGNELGVDKVATSNNTIKSYEQFFSERDFVVKFCKKNNWNLVGENK